MKEVREMERQTESIRERGTRRKKARNVKEEREKKTQRSYWILYTP